MLQDNRLSLASVVVVGLFHLISYNDISVEIAGLHEIWGVWFGQPYH